MLRSLLLLFLLLPASSAGAQDIALDATTSETVVRTGEHVAFMVVASNPGLTTLSDVVVEVLLPDDIDDFDEWPGFDCPNVDCDPNETGTWTVGTLPPGASRVLTFSTYVLAGTPDGTELTLRASSGGVIEETELLVSSTTPASVQIAAEGDQVLASGLLTYAITVGNRETVTLTGATLRLPVPAGTTFRSASEGGELQGDEVVWAFPPIPPTAGALVHATFQVESGLAGGTALSARATLESGGTGAPVGAATTTVVRGGNAALRLGYAAAEAVARPGEVQLYTLRATNAGSDPLFETAVEVLLPDAIDDFDEWPGFDCPNVDCDANERGTWTIGTLAPGATRTLTLPIAQLAATPQGRVLRSVAQGRATGLTYTPLATAISRSDASMVASLAIVPDGNPATAGGQVEYTVSLGNREVVTLSGLTLRLPVPAGTTFSSATGGGTLQGGAASGEVVWAIPALPPQSGGLLRATFDVAGGLLDGFVTTARATLDTGVSGKAVGASASTTTARPSAVPPLALSYTAARAVAEPGELVLYTVRATNTGTDPLFETTVEVRLPDGIDDFDEPTDFDCPNVDCDPSERGTWTVGTLAPGASRTLTLPIAPLGATPRGRVLHSVVNGQATGLAVHPWGAVGLVIGTPFAVAAEPEGEGLRAVTVRVSPMPFADRAVVTTTVPRAMDVRLVAYDLLGREVAVVFAGTLAAGSTKLPWDGRALPAGRYLLRLQTPDGTASRILVKS